MAVYSKPSSAVSLYLTRKIAVASSLPLEHSVLQLVMSFPFNVLLALTLVLIIGIIRTFTRKPARIDDSIVEAEGQLTKGTKEEMPRSFKSSREAVTELYSWFYRFAQGRLGGIADNMTPREFMRVVSGRIPSQGALPLEYLVTSFEIAMYSESKSTSEMQSKCFESVEVLKDLIEGRDSTKSEDVKVDELSTELVTHNIQVNEAYSD